MKMFTPGGVSLGYLLIALGIGYIVCSQAKKEAGALKKLGYIIGAVIIAVSGLLIACKALLFCGISNKTCPLRGMMEKGMMRQEQMPVVQK